MVTYRAAKLVNYSYTPLPEDESQALLVRIDYDQKFVKDCRDHSDMLKLLSLFMKGQIDRTKIKSPFRIGGVLLVEHAMMNRAEFAISQYRRALLHIDNLSAEEQARVKREVLEDLEYVIELFQPMLQKTATALLPLSKRMRTLVNNSFRTSGSANDYRRIPNLVDTDVMEVKQPDEDAADAMRDILNSNVLH